MTTILAIQGEGWAVVGSDSRISTIYGEASAEVGTLSATNPKIGNNGKYILGAAGDLRAINILHHAFQPPACPPNLKGKKLDQFITTKFIPALRACFDEQGYSQPENKDGKDHIAQHDSQIVCIVNNTIYIIDGDYSWFTNNTGLYGIGSGASYAIGALSVITSTARTTLQSAKKAIAKSLTMASRFDPHTGGPYTVYTQGTELPPVPKPPVTKKPPTRKKK
jgi:ATP-dependent protease HslVU (ClpYQ) peptidase subunit